MSDSFIGRGEKLTERIICRLFRNTDIHRQVPISKLIKNEDYTEYGEEYSKHKCDLLIRVVCTSGKINNLVIEVNYKHKEKAAKKWSNTFAPDIAKAGNIPVTIKANVSGNQITFEPENRAEIKREFFRYIKDWTDNSATITKGHEFDIISQILESEFQNYNKRILVLEEKGFHVKIMENGN